MRFFPPESGKIYSVMNMKKYDLIIIGGGPAGITAGIYAMRAGLSCLIIEKRLLGGQITDSAEVENLPPVEKMSGYELAQKFSARAEGIEKFYGTVTEVTENFEVTAGGETFSAKAIILANGAARRRLSCIGEEKFAGRGVSYCAICDGSFFKDKTVAVVGGGNTGLEEAIYLSKLCEKVYLIHRGEQLRGQNYLIKRATENPKVEVLLSATVSEIYGENTVEGIVVNGKNLPVSGVFVAVGLKPENEIFSSLVNLDERGYIIAGENCKTSRDGIFCAGDARTKELRQIITAMADGAAAATAAEKYIHGLG